MQQYMTYSFFIKIVFVLSSEVNLFSNLHDFLAAQLAN